MEPRKGCRICMRDLPPGALTPEILLPEGFTALRAKSPKSYNQQIIRCTEWEDTCIPPRSIGTTTLVPVNVPQSLSLRQNLFCEKKLLAGENNAGRYRFRKDHLRLLPRLLGR